MNVKKKPNIDALPMRKQLIKNAKTIVVKIGTNTIMKNGCFNSALVDFLAGEIAKQSSLGKKFILVSSGAIGTGRRALGFSGENPSLPQQQALASVGQHLLIHDFMGCFSKFYLPVAQVLLTQDNFSDKKRLSCLRESINALLEMSVVPIINENDAVAVEELASEKKFSDNDILSALVASAVGADLLVLFTDVEGVFEEDPRVNSNTSIVREVRDVSALRINAGNSGSGGRGGFKTKIEAVEIALKKGVSVIIAKGSPENAAKALSGEETGTIFYV